MMYINMWYMLSSMSQTDTWHQILGYKTLGKETAHSTIMFKMTINRLILAIWVYINYVKNHCPPEDGSRLKDRWSF